MTYDPVPRSFNLAAYVLSAAALNPDRIALSIVGRDVEDHWTYEQIRAAILGTATGLLNTGLTAGDKVLLRIGNTPDFPIVFLACLAVDLIPVPTSAQLTRAEITALATMLAPKAIIAAEGIALPDYPAPIHSTKDLRAFYALPPAPFSMGDPDRAGYIIFTSGTSGSPRGVIHAHRAIWARRMMFDGWYGLTPQDRMLHAGAFNWTYTLGTGLMDPWTLGATAVVPTSDTTPQDLPDLIRSHSATIFASAPGIYRQLLKSKIGPLPTLRHGLSAGEKLPETTRATWTKATNTPIYEAFGMSECSTFISGSPSRPAAAGTLGQPQAGRQIALLARGAPSDAGQIAVHKSDPGLMLGYLDAPAETQDRFDGDWFLTGDMGRRTTNGSISYDGRADDMMNAGGYRVSPIEVEAALALHPAIDDSAVVELRVKSDASVIAAFYTSANVIDESELVAHLAAHLARYKTPRQFIRVDRLPRGANNKLQRRALRTEPEADNGQT